MNSNEIDRFYLRNKSRKKKTAMQRLGKAFGNLTIVLVVLGLSLAQTTNGQEVAQFFKQNCSSCHWIGGGRLIGPDLKDVSSRKGRDWLVPFIVDPKSFLDSRDPYAVKLQAEAKGAIMIQAPGINEKLANSLLDLIEAESQLDSSQFAGKAVQIGPYSAADAKAGIDIFSGRTGLKNGGRACISCHTVNSAGASLGGRLGPDLTSILERLQGRAGLTAWLGAPPTSTMKTIFKDNPFEEEEIKFLVAYFESAANNDKYNFDSFIIWMSVIFCGLGGSVFGMVLISGIWGNRFRAVRRPLVKVSKIRGES